MLNLLFVLLFVMLVWNARESAFLQFSSQAIAVAVFTQSSQNFHMLWPIFCEVDTPYRNDLAFSKIRITRCYGVGSIIQIAISA
jgi:hypothetical protein